MNTQLLFAILTQLIALYMVTIGIGMVFGGNAGATRAHRWWMWAISRIIAWILNAIGDIFRWAASKIPR